VLNKREKQYVAAVNHVFTSEQGLLVLKHLKQDYMDRTTKGSDPYETYYRLGQESIIKELLSIINDDDAVENANLDTGARYD
jgi:hypothetical protein